MSVLLIRHGQTAGNLAHRYIGVVALCCLDCSEKLISVLFLADDTLFNKLLSLLLESEYIRNILYIFLADKVLNINLAKSLDIHSIS